MPLSSQSTINKIRNLKRGRGIISSDSGGSGGNFNYDSHSRTTNLLAEMRSIFTNNFNIWDSEKYPDVDTALRDFHNPEVGLSMIKNLFIHKTDWYPWREETIKDLEKTSKELSKMIEEGVFVRPEQKEALRRVTNELREIEQKRQNLEKEVKTKDQEIKELQNEIQTMMGSSFGQKKEYVQGLQNRLKTEQEKAVKLEREITQLKRNQEHQLEKQNRKEEDLEEEIERIKRQFENYKIDQNLKPQEQKLQELLKKGKYDWITNKESLKKQFIEIRRDHMRMPWIEFWNSLDALIDRLNEIDKKTTTINQLNKDLQGKNTEYQTTRDEKRAVEEELDRKSSEITRLETDVTSLKDTIKRLKEQQKADQTKIAELIDEGKKKDMIINGYKAGTADASKHYDWQREIEKLNLEIAALKRDRETEQAALLNCRGDVSRAEQKVRDKDAECNRKIKDLEDRMNDEKAAAKRQEEGDKEVTKDAQDKVEAVRKKFEDLLASIKTASREVTVLDGSIRYANDVRIYRHIMGGPPIKITRSNFTWDQKGKIVNEFFTWDWNYDSGLSSSIELKVPLKILHVYAYRESAMKDELGYENWTGNRVDVVLDRHGGHGGMAWQS